MKPRLAALSLITVLVIGTAGWAYFQALPGPAMTDAATKFLGTLTEEQRKTAIVEYDSPKRVDWHFIPKDQRKGLQIRDMNPAQRAAAHALLRSALSQIGNDKAVKIMSLEAILRELESRKEKKGPLRDPERYYFTIFGQPSATSKWGLSVEGHHLSLNFVVENGRVVSSTPTVYGANPAIVMSEVSGGQPKGTRVLAKEEERAFELLASLTPEQRKTAVINAKAPGDVRGAGEAQPSTEPPVGLAASQMTPDQVKTLNALIESYTENLPDQVAQERWSAIRAAEFSKIQFAWAGADKPGVGHYYRVQGPTFVIEFVNTQPDSAGNTANHIHSFWRDMRGDFAIPVK
jgi:hypothetical protein